MFGGNWFCASAHQAFISIEGMESVVDLASYNLRRMPSYDNPFEVIPLFEPMLPRIHPLIYPEIVLNKIESIYSAPCFD
jgi:hypothetical protein